MDAPARRLSPQARWVWALQQVMSWGVLLVLSLPLSSRVDDIGWLPILLFALLVLAAILVPVVRWRRWRWDVRDEGIDIQQGTFTVRRTLVPWVRVQHVDTKRGLIEQSLGLATVVVHTAAGGHTIPLLARDDAEELRERIAGLARTDD